MIENTLVLQGFCWKAEAAPTLGGNLIRLDYRGTRVLHPLEDAEQLKSDPFVYGSPILFPANRTYAGRFDFEGRTYRLPVNEPKNNAHLHGLVYKQVFSVVSCSDSAVTLCYENVDEVYPFPFRLTVRYSLTEQGACASYQFLNTGSTAMPMTFALHTAFEEPDAFCVPISMAQEQDGHHIPTGRYIPLSDEEKQYTISAPSTGHDISGYYLACGHTARIGRTILYTVSDNFDHWVLYNAQGADGLLCVEPQCGSVNGLNLKNGCRVLRAGETILFCTLISIRDKTRNIA